MPVGTSVVIGFTVFVITHRTVNFGDGLGWHQLLQEEHIGRRNSCIHQEIGTGKAEHYTELVGTE